MIDIGLANVFEHVAQLPKRGVSTKIQDYMHLPNFEEVVKNSQNIQDLVQISPVSLLGFTEENQRDILWHVLGGAPLDIALDAVRIKKKAYETWERLAEHDVEPFLSFIAEVRAAKAFFAMEMIQKMRHSKMHIVELWKIHYPETMLNGQTQLQQNVVVNFMDKPAAERAADIKATIIDIDPKEIDNYPVKDVDDE